MLANQSVVKLDQALKAHKPKDSTEAYRQFDVSALALDKVGDILAANSQDSTAEEMYKRVIKIRERAATEPKNDAKLTNEDFFKFMVQTLDDAPPRSPTPMTKLVASISREASSTQQFLCISGRSS